MGVTQEHFCQILVSLKRHQHNSNDKKHLMCMSGGQSVESQIAMG